MRPPTTLLLAPRIIAAMLLLLPFCSRDVAAENGQPQSASPTEGIITHQFVDEPQMQDGLLAMLSRFSSYMSGVYMPLPEQKKAGKPCGVFRSNSTQTATEDGVRTNADLSMVCAFLYKYGQEEVLPEGITRETLKNMALGSLHYAVATHKAVRLVTCSDNRYWGSTGVKDAQWESSLWAMSVAYSAFFLWDDLSKKDRQNIYKLLKAECQYELERSIPTAFQGDTKAEENGWEAGVLAATLGLYPNDKLAPQWFDRLRRFAINSYSHENDANDTTVVDRHYDNARIMDLYEGANLYPDYTLQNHNYFHTSYQNVVIQELGEAALALKLFQTNLHGKEKWHTCALLHNCTEVQRRVLDYLALADGDLAMPNGNDWSLFLFDQITSYSTLACFAQDADALMLENMAYKQIEARQTTTTDASWLLRSDIGPRRMGVQAHRLMMTWLMHHEMPTADLSPTLWSDFRERHADARVLESQSIVRAFTKQRFTTFGWQTGIGSYTGYIASNTPDRNKIMVPYKQHNTGNLLGWFTVKDRQTNTVPACPPRILTEGTAWTLNGHLLCNDSTLDHRFVIYSTPGNAVIYMDCVTARQPVTIMREQGGLMAISTDEFTRQMRTIYYHPEPLTAEDADADDDSTVGDICAITTNGDSLALFNTLWVNIDNEMGVLTPGDRQQAFGHRSDNNSIMTAKLYAHYRDNEPAGKCYEAGEMVAQRQMVCYTGVTAEQTLHLSRRLRLIGEEVHNIDCDNGIVAEDPDGTQYFLITNFHTAADSITISHFRERLGAPVFNMETTIRNSQSFANIPLKPNESYSQQLHYYIDGTDVVAREKDKSLWIKALADTQITIRKVDGWAETVDLTQGQEKVFGPGE